MQKLNDFHFNDYVLNIIDTLKHEEFKQAVRDFIHVSHLDFTVIKNGGYRTAEEQNELFRKGVTKCDGYKYKSKHQSGLAIDLVPWVDNKPTWDKSKAYAISKAFFYFCLGRGLLIRCGADWDMKLNFIDWDPYHFEVIL